jgi:MFS family permease
MKPLDPVGNAITTLRLSLYLAILVCAYIFAFADRQIVSLVVQPIKTDLVISDVQIGLVQGVAFALVYSVAGLLCGAAADRFSRRLIIVLGITIWSLGSAACGLATSFVALIICRLVVGLGEASLSPSAYSLLSDWTPRKRLSAVIGIYTTGSNLGGGIALTLGGALVQYLGTSRQVSVPGLGEVAPWRAAFLATGLPGLGVAALALFLREPPRRQLGASEAAELPIGFVEFCRKNARLLCSHLIGFALLGMVAAATLGWGPAYLHRRFEWQSAKVGLALGVMIGVFGTMGTVFGGVIVDRLYSSGMKDAHLRFHVWTNLVGGACAVSAFLTESPWICVGLLWCAFPILISFGGSAPAAIQLIAPRNLRGRLSALYLLAATGIGIGLGPVSVALLAKWVFHDDQQLGAPLALLTGMCVIVSTALFARGLRPLRSFYEPSEENGLKR